MNSLRQNTILPRSTDLIIISYSDLLMAYFTQGILHYRPIPHWTNLLKNLEYFVNRINDIRAKLIPYDNVIF